MTEPRLLPAEAYRAMLRFLERYQTRGNGRLTDLLSDMQLLADDGRPADPATWADWLDAVHAEKVAKSATPGLFKSVG